MWALKTWSNTARFCTACIVVTACVITLMMLTASNPSADDFWRAMPLIIAAIGSFLAGKHFGKKEEEHGS